MPGPRRRREGQDRQHRPRQRQSALRLPDRPVFRRQGYDKPVPALPTFGDIQTGLGGAYASDCLALCGNAADPVVTLTYQGSHADNFNTLYAEVSVVDDPVVAAWQDWSTHLAAKTGQAKLEGGTDGLDDTMQPVAIKDFAAIRPTTIRVGRGFAGSGCLRTPDRVHGWR